VSIVAVSTFDTDYVLVKQADLGARSRLSSARDGGKAEPRRPGDPGAVGRATMNIEIV
jgi:hypothetical protein